jgi:hypothetical protein
MLIPGNGWVQLGETGGFETSREPKSGCITWQVHRLFMAADEKFLEYHRENEERKGKPYLRAEEQRQFVQDAGFVDIQVIQKWCDHGTYTKGTFIAIRVLITQDPVSKRAGLIGRYAHGSLWPIIGMRLTQIEDVEERRAFTERALNALCSGTEPLGVLKDVSNYGLLLMGLDIRL